MNTANSRSLYCETRQTRRSVSVTVIRNRNNPHYSAYTHSHQHIYTDSLFHSHNHTDAVFFKRSIIVN